MKKRILALALAAATAFSMFGASLSVSAAGEAGKVASYFDSITGTYVDEGDADYDKFIGEMEAIQARIVEDEDGAYEDGKIYAYDYNAAAWGEFESALNAALEATPSTDEVYASMYATLANSVKTKGQALDGKLDLNNSYNASSLRISLLTSYKADKAAVAKLNASDYDADSQAALTALKDTYFAAEAEALQNSLIVRAIAKYDEFIDNAGLADVDKAYEDALNALDAAIADAESALEYRDEYKTTTAANRAFTNLEKALDAAYDVAGSYDVAYSKLTTVLSDLQKAVNAVEVYGVAASKATKDALAAAITKANACKEDDGYKTDDGSDAAKAFQTALTRAEALKGTKATEHRVADATEALLDAIDNLKVVAARPSHVLEVQEDLEALGAFDKVESDYTAKTWADFEAALAQYEEAVTTAEVDAAKAKVVAKLDALKPLSTRTAKNEFNAALREAEALAKDTKDKSLAAVNSFKAAVDAAKDFKSKATSKTTISQYEAQTAALEAAIKAYKENKVVAAYEGWAYDKGVWTFYVKGEAVTGWNKIDNVWYYMNDKGVMQTGWVKVDGAWYYLKDWGGMATGWAQVKGTWYFLDASGKCVMNTWKEINGKWYYFNASGAMAVNTTINGYKVDANGVWVK